MRESEKVVEGKRRRISEGEKGGLKREGNNE